MPVFDVIVLTLIVTVCVAFGAMLASTSASAQFTAPGTGITTIRPAT